MTVATPATSAKTMSLGQTGIEAKTTMAEKLKEKSDDRWWLKAVLALESRPCDGTYGGLGPGWPDTLRPGRMVHFVHFQITRPGHSRPWPRDRPDCPLNSKPKMHSVFHPVNILGKCLPSACSLFT